MSEITAFLKSIEKVKKALGDAPLRVYGGARSPAKVRGKTVAASSPKKKAKTTKRPRPSPRPSPARKASNPEGFFTAPLEAPPRITTVEISKPGRFFPKAHQGSPTVIGEGELATFEEVTVGPISSFGTRAAAEVLQTTRSVDPLPKSRVDPVISATAAHVEQQRAHTLALEQARTEVIKRGNWKRQCQARDAEDGLQCGQLEGHEIASSRYPATKHRNARGEFVRVLQPGQEPSRRRELDGWAQDRRDVGGVSP